MVGGGGGGGGGEVAELVQCQRSLNEKCANKYMQ